MQKFSTGQPVRRVEDERFLTGSGQYVDDLVLDGMVHAAFVRSPHGHAKILSIETEDAQSAPGVLQVLTHEDVKAAGLGPLPTVGVVDGVDDNGINIPERHALTGDVARYAGDPVAMVIAGTRQQARDGAERVMVDYEDLAGVAGLRGVLDADSPAVWPQFGSNRCYHFHKGDAAAADAALAGAHHVARVELVNNRVCPSAIEPRGVIGDYDSAIEQYILHVSGQAVHGQRRQMADAVFKVPHDNIRVIMPDVGGGFGGKNFVYPENVMVMLAAKLCGRPVKWIAGRSENFLCEIHARDHLTQVALGLDEDGRFVALKVETIANMGAYLSSFATIIPTSASWVSMGGVYDVPVISMSVDAVFTNTVPVDAYRGAGRPEAAYLMERIVDVAAHDLGLDALELRQRNVVKTFPHRTALGMMMDCGGFGQNLQLAAAKAHWDSFDGRCKAAKARGALRGRGISCYLEVTLGPPADDAELRFNDAGGVDLLVGGQTNGQGHQTAYLQVLGDELGLGPDDVRYIQGDTGLIGEGGGYGGARSLGTIGSALLGASAKVREKGILAAAHVLDGDADQISFDDGLFRLAGTNRQISVLELEAALRADDDLPGDVPDSLSSKAHYEREAFNYPNGVHMAEVEVDGDTGQITLCSYVVIDDFGRIVNPLIAEGQVLGGTVQGIGQAMLEEALYDENGQLLTGSYMDYCLPRAGDLCAIDVSFNEDYPTKTNPMGVKGAGEAGATGAPPALVNAVVNALSVHAVRHVDMPLTPLKVWQALHR